MAHPRQPKLLTQVRETMRRMHYSIHTERSYLVWIKRYIRFHHMRSREDLEGGTLKVEAFLTHLALKRKVAPSTQNQALNALVFLYKKVLEIDLEGTINAARSSKNPRIPVVLTRAEVKQLIPLICGMPQLVAKIIYGSGLRITEAVRLRVADVDIAMSSITVRDGKEKKTVSRLFRRESLQNATVRTTTLTTHPDLVERGRKGATVSQPHIFL